jgi:chromosome segregation ATPase
MNEQMTSIKRSIEELQRQIAQARVKAAANSEGAQERLVAQLDEATAEVARCEGALRDAEAALPNKQQALSDVNVRGRQVEQDSKSARDAVEQIRVQLNNLQSQRVDELAAFGRDVHRALDRIKNTRWHGQPPVGPFGRFVKVRDPKRWAAILRIQIGNLMSGYAVTDPRDQGTLRQILKETGKCVARTACFS